MLGDFIILNKESSKNLNTQSAINFLNQKHEKYTFITKFENFEIHLFHNESEKFQDSNFLFFGFLSYKNRVNEEAVELLLSESTPDWQCTYGDYFIFYKEKDKYKIICDPLRKFHVFKLKNIEVYSSSFLACGHLCENLSINEIAVYEKLCLGYNIAPNTLFNEINRIYSPENTNSSNTELVNNLIDFKDIKFYTSKNEALKESIKTINKQFNSYKSFFSQGVDLGLSDGMDSRLVLALLLNQNIQDIQLHTHATKGVHDKEKGTAQIIAEKMKLPIKRVECERLEKQPKEKLEEIILDNFVYYDGQNSFNMGAFAQNYTKWYKDQVMGEYKVSLNGLGGEVYRNYYYTNHGNRNFKEFGKNWLFYRFAHEYLPEGEFDEFWEYFTNTVSTRLDINILKKVNLKTIRRYYSEINMADGDAINNNAHNKFYYFLTPFIEPEVLINAYRILPFIGNSTLFEGEMIHIINPELATIKTHYDNKGTNKISWKPRLKYFIYAIAPEFLNRIKFNTHKKKILKTKGANPLLEHFKDNAPETLNAWNLLKELFPNINYELIEIDYYAQATALRLAECLYYFRNKI